jgi:hypothetical protein
VGCLPEPTQLSDVSYGMKHLLIAATASLALVANAPCATAQGYPFSQRQSVTQGVANTTISIEYGRPVARGRVLWGQLVPWDSIWHPGADTATRIVISRDITVEGKALKAGEYSLWLIPREKTAWTVIFSSAARTFHKPYPGANTEVLRIDVAPETTSHMESFAIYFPAVLRDDATMRLHWGTSAISLRLKAPWKPE